MINSFSGSLLQVIASDPMLASMINFSRKRACHGQSILCPFSHFCYASSSENLPLFVFACLHI